MWDIMRCWVRMYLEILCSVGHYEMLSKDVFIDIETENKTMNA